MGFPCLPVLPCPVSSRSAPEQSCLTERGWVAVPVGLGPAPSLQKGLEPQPLKAGVRFGGRTGEGSPQGLRQRQCSSPFPGEPSLRDRTAQPLLFPSLI